MIQHLLRLLTWFRDFFVITSAGWLFAIILFYKFPVLEFLKLASDKGAAWAVGVCFAVMFMLCSCVSGLIYYMVTGRNGIDVILRMEWSR